MVNLSAVQARAQDALFVQHSGLGALQARLPLLWPTPPDVPPSPKRTYRSHYVYLGWEDLLDPAVWEPLSDFDLVLRLVDFSGLRPALAQRLGWTSARGWQPFDPVSLFLLHGWQISNGWSRAETLRNLANPLYADQARRFLTALGRHSEAEGHTLTVETDEGSTVEVAIQYLNQLLVGAVTLLRQADLFSPQAWSQALTGTAASLTGRFAESYYLATPGFPHQL